MAQGHGRVEVQAGDHTGQEDARHHLHQEGPDIDVADLGEHVPQLAERRECLEELRQAGARLEEDRQGAQEEDRQVRRQDPHQRYDQLGPDQLMDVHGQGVHQIALVAQEVAIEAQHHHDDRQQLGQDHRDEGRDQHQHRQDRQQPADIPLHHAHGDVRQHDQPRQHAQHGEHEPPSGRKFMFQQFP